MRLPQISDSDRCSIEKEYLGIEYLVSYKSSHCGYLGLIISSAVLWDVKRESHNDGSLRPRLGGNPSVVDYATPGQATPQSKLCFFGYLIPVTATLVFSFSPDLRSLVMTGQEWMRTGIAHSSMTRITLQGVVILI